MVRRKKPTYAQRTTPCIACNYPLSQQHHLLAVAEHGVNPYTVPLCANCHEIFHIARNIYRHNTRYAIDVAVHLLEQDNDAITYSLIHLCGMVLVSERVVGKEFAAMTVEERTRVVAKNFSSLMTAWRQASNRKSLPGFEE